MQQIKQIFLEGESLTLIFYDRVGDGDKISKENFGSGKPCFHATSQLKVKW